MNKAIYQAPSAELYGDIRLEKGVSIWPKVVMRAESDHIEIGEYTNIQDFTMIHIANVPTKIGAYCSITHHCTIHGATIGDNCLIGINATPSWTGWSLATIASSLDIPLLPRTP